MILSKIDFDCFLAYYIDNNKELLYQLIEKKLSQRKIIYIDPFAAKLNLQNDENGEPILFRSVVTSGTYCVEMSNKHNVKEIFSIFDRGLGGKQIIENAGIRFSSLININI